jgi:hypothetical protein
VMEYDNATRREEGATPAWEIPLSLPSDTQRTDLIVPPQTNMSTLPIVSSDKTSGGTEITFPPASSANSTQYLLDADKALTQSTFYFTTRTRSGIAASRQPRSPAPVRPSPPASPDETSSEASNLVYEEIYQAAIKAGLVIPL